MKKLLFIASLLACLALVLFFVFGTKAKQFEDMAAAGEEAVIDPESVSTFIAQEQTWTRSLRAVGSIDPIQGVLLESEAAGVVESINFKNGQPVNEGDVLVQLDVKVEVAELKAAEALARLAEVELERAQRLRKSGNVPQSDLDRAIADEQKTKADVETIKARIARKTIKAPFTGRVGIRQVNRGQFISIGAPIVALQANEQVYVTFTLPQQALGQIETGLQLNLSSDVHPEIDFVGEITAVSPELDATTRAVRIQGTLDNPDGHLRPGLFVRVEVVLPQTETVLAVPATSILYAPYGNSIFKVEDGESGLIAKQYFIRIGSRKGDYVSIEQGAEVGDQVVSSGAFKLRTGINVVVNNELAPDAQIDPKPDNS